MKKLFAAIAVLAVAAVVAFRFVDTSLLIESKRHSNDDTIAENLAYHYGFSAYLYGYPIVDMATQMHNETHLVEDGQQVYAPVNRLYRFQELVTPETSGGLRAPNNVTLYFSGWYDVSEEPLIIHTPDTAGRYYTIAVTNQYSEVVHIGRRTTGTAAGYFALVPPHWDGDLPDGVIAVPVESNRGWLLGRMYVAGRDDFPQARALVDAIWLAGLSEFSFDSPPLDPVPRSADVMSPMDSLEFFEILNTELKQLPRRASEAALLAQLDEIGIGPSSDFDITAIDDATRKGLQRAIADAREVVNASTFRTIPTVNGWMISQDIGRYGFQYMHRASVVKGGYGNLPEESLYPAALYDADGNALHGRHRYELHFGPGGLPPVDGFWSLSVYTRDAQLTENSIERYSIGNLTEGLQYADDGSLTLHLQHEQPVGKESNWLPTPDGAWFAVMRLYEPLPAALKDEYQLPRLRRVD